MGTMAVASLVSVTIVSGSVITQSIQKHAREKYKTYFRKKYIPVTKDDSQLQIYRNLIKCLMVHSEGVAHYVIQVTVPGNYFGEENPKTVPFAACTIVMTDQPSKWFPSKLRMLFNSQDNSVVIMTETSKDLQKFINILSGPDFDPAGVETPLHFLCSEGDISKM